MVSNLRKAEIKHECGHLVVAKLMGFQTGNIEIHDGHSLAGLSFAETVGVVRLKCIRRRIMVLFAGSLAQSIMTIKPNTSAAEVFLRQNAVGDNQNIEELLQEYLDSTLPEGTPDSLREMERKQRRTGLLQEAATIVGDNRDVIMELAREVQAAYLAEGQPQDFVFPAERIDALPVIVKLMNRRGRAQ